MSSMSSAAMPFQFEFFQLLLLCSFGDVMPFMALYAKLQGQVLRKCLHCKVAPLLAPLC